MLNEPFTHTDDNKRARINLNPQFTDQPLLPADVVDEPGVAPLQVTQRLVGNVIAKTPDIRAPGTLPQEHRIIKALVRHGALPHITKWTNAVLSGRVHPRARDLLAGHLRAGLLQKRDAVAD
eukprot:4832975-Prymnesium_polylepis.1